MSVPAIDFDGPWKAALEEYLEDFFALCFPAIHAAIDWSRGYSFLDMELQKVVRDAEVGLLRMDRLLQVWQHNGENAWVLLHVEVQNQEEAEFPVRMCLYNQRLFDRYQRPVASLAVLGDERLNWRPATYRRDLFGSYTDFGFPIVKLADWRVRLPVLEASDNPFATVILAHLAAQDTRQDLPERQRAKLGLIRRLYDKGYSKERVLSLFRFIDWLLALPRAAEREVRHTIAQWEEERQMPYITSVERLALEEGREEGREEGLKQAEKKVCRRVEKKVCRRASLWLCAVLSNGCLSAASAWTPPPLQVDSGKCRI